MDAYERLQADDFGTVKPAAEADLTESQRLGAMLFEDIELGDPPPRAIDITLEYEDRTDDRRFELETEGGPPAGERPASLKMVVAARAALSVVRDRGNSAEILLRDTEYPYAVQAMDAAASQMGWQRQGEADWVSYGSDGLSVTLRSRPQSEWRNGILADLT